MVGANEEAAPVGMAGWNLDWGLDLGLPFKTATPELHRLVIRGWTLTTVEAIKFAKATRV